jgi:hypothetical protein
MSTKAETGRPVVAGTHGAQTARMKAARVRNHFAGVSECRMHVQQGCAREGDEQA